MTKKASGTSAIDLPELKDLLGPAPVLSTESERSFHEIWARLVQDIRPDDFIEQLLIRQIADCTWEIIRYTRHKTLTIERAFRQHCEIRARRKQTPTRAAAEEVAEPGSEFDRLCELEDVVEGTVEDVDEILNRPPKELDHAEGLEKSIEYHERLDKLLNLAVMRRNDTLRLLEEYREGFGRRARLVSDRIINGAYKDAEPEPLQVEAPLAPSDGERNDL